MKSLVDCGLGVLGRGKLCNRRTGWVHFGRFHLVGRFCPVNWLLLVDQFHKGGQVHRINRFHRSDQIRQVGITELRFRRPSSLSRIRLAMKDDERGSGSGLVIAIAMLCIFVACVLMVFGSWFVCVQQARTVADLSALSGAHAQVSGADACVVARENARANGGRLGDCRVEISSTGEFIVEVRAEVDLRPKLRGAPEKVSETARAGTVHS